MESCEGRWILIRLFCIFYHGKLQRNSKLTLADFLVCHVVPSREAVFGHGHVGVEGQRENPCRWVDLRRHPGPAVSADQGPHCGIKKLTLNTGGKKTFHVRPLWFHLITFQVFTCQFQPESFYLLFRTALRRIWAFGSRTLSHILPGLKIELLTFKGNKNHHTYTGTTFPSQKTAKQSQGESSTWSRKGTLDVVPT